MSALYGRVQGNRGEATRGGSDYLHTTAETWQGKIRVDLSRDGSYSVTLSGKDGEHSREVLRGNIDARTIEVLLLTDYGQEEPEEATA